VTAECKGDIDLTVIEIVSRGSEVTGCTFITQSDRFRAGMPIEIYVPDDEWHMRVRSVAKTLGTFQVDCGEPGRMGVA
jgi:hypothetical protein